MASMLHAALILAALLALSVQTTTATQLSGSTTEWPSLRFHFTIKRSSMKVHGQSDFSMYANPIVSSRADSVLYDVFATFTEDSKLYNYTLINGVAHSTSTPYSGNPSDDVKPTPTVSCVDAESSKLPNINAIVSALNGATATPKSNDITCASGNLFKVTVYGIDFALCASGSAGFIMHGSDMDIDVEFLESPIDIVVPTQKDKTECKKIASASSVTVTSKGLLTGQQFSDKARHLKAAMSFSFRDKSTCSCKSTPRPCVFIHGLGVKDEMPENQDEFTDYWGKYLAGHGPCCSSMKFAHLNTVNSTWTDAILQGKVCNRALTASNTSKDSVISDTIVVTHSMGNVMFAGALSTGKCRLDSSSTWVGMAGSMFGSMCSDFVQDSCAGKTNIVWEKIGNITGRCPPNTGLKSLAYEGGSYSSQASDAAYKAAQEVYRTNVSALMCGKSSSGLVSKYQAQFWGLSMMVPHKSKLNDGMVEFQSCAAGFPESKFGANYRDRFYVTKLNHYDMQFRAGDSLLDEEKMPLKWFDCLL
ncbi:hypothetical protein PI124_g19965 [Phytophthora idaei]|nr:hypothetical protein PI125_g21093 [Phytophthora idaei]KAG3132907.1 hypothetical protein PI126_g19425 [Phytophthora idaei]KAG3234999.1 hypothetical protein PI124_g19965 [Phytophthora idaei]